VVPLVRTTVNVADVSVGKAVTVFAPLDCTVTTPVELFWMKYRWPSTIVEVTGNVTVCVVLPVKNCWLAEDTVSVVVPAAVAVVAYP